MKKRKTGYLFAAGIFLLILSFFIEISPVSGKTMKEMQDNLEDITEEEKTVLRELFLITQEIEAMERDQEELTSQMETMQADTVSIEDKIQKQQMDYDRKLSIMKDVLVSYQKRGPASYLETILDAKDLNTFLRSINVIQNLSRNVDDLLLDMEIGKQKLEEDKILLEEKSRKVDEKRAELQNTLQSKRQLKDKQEAYLNSLQGDKKYYEEQLNHLEGMWEECKAIFSKIVEEFKTIITAGHFINEDLNLSISFFKISGYIQEDTFNKIMKENSKLPEMVFHFKDDAIELEIPDNHLKLQGNFTIEEKNSIIFQVESGSFYDFTLEKAAINDLFRDGAIAIGFMDLAGDMLMYDVNLESVSSKEGYLEFQMKPNF